MLRLPGLRRGHLVARRLDPHGTNLAALSGLPAVPPPPLYALRLALDRLDESLPLTPHLEVSPAVDGIELGQEAGQGLFVAVHGCIAWRKGEFRGR